MSRYKKTYKTRVNFAEGIQVDGTDLGADIASGTQQANIVDLTNNSGGAVSNTIAAATNIAALTDSSGGAKDNTIEAVGATNGGDVSGAINNNFAELAEELIAQRTLNTVLINAVASLAAKVNALNAALEAFGITADS
jgi:hypothetical protein